MRTDRGNFRCHPLRPHGTRCSQVRTHYFSLIECRFLYLQYPTRYAARFKEGDGDEDWGFQPKSKMDDSVRFARCERLLVNCSSCHKETPLPGVLNPATAHSGLDCTNCGSMFLGRNNANACYCYLSNRITLTVRSCVRRYYDAWLTCDDHTCGCRTKQQSVLGTNCVMRCNGRLSPEYDDETLHTQLKYFETLFNVQRYREKHPAANVDR